MKAVKVRYEVKPEFVDQNKKNIQAVTEFLKANPIEGMYYFSSQLEDGSFMHINVAKDDETMAKLNAVEAFSHFRMELKASEPISTPESEKLEIVGMGWDL